MVSFWASRKKLAAGAAKLPAYFTSFFHSHQKAASAAHTEAAITARSLGLISSSAYTGFSSSSRGTRRR